MAVGHVREVAERGLVFAVPIAGDFNEGGERGGGNGGRVHPRGGGQGEVRGCDGRVAGEEVGLGVVVGEGTIFGEGQ